jgi:C_GCAxxG_C_C family probable redox protein
MSKADEAETFFRNGCNCAQAVFSAYAADFGLERKWALSLAVGFGAGMGRTQDVCGAVSGAIMVLGLNSGFKEGDGREGINAAYVLVHSFIEEFEREKGTVKCLDLLSGCNLQSPEGQKQFREENLRERCFSYVRTSCGILDKIMESRSV